MRKYLVAVMLGLLLVMPVAFAQDSGVTGLTCAKSGTITRGKFITDLCWGCFFPITIGGARTSPGPLPEGRAAPMCVCPSRAFGIPSPGLTVGIWEPTHTVTSTRNAFCFPELDKQWIGKGFNSATMGGTGQSARDNYRHVHVMMFPVDVIMNMFESSVCASGSSGLDILFISEIDPTHNDEPLAMMTTPEAFLTTNPVGQAACLADAVAASATKPIRALFWCAGSWSQLYPLAGYRNTANSAPVNAASGMARGVAMMHRRTLMSRTYGPGAVCNDVPDLMLPKQQYRYQSMYPLPSRLYNEWMGRSSLLGREPRHLPGVGEDFVNVLWTFQECCAHF